MDRLANLKTVVGVIGLCGLIVSPGCATPLRTFQPAQDPAGLPDATFLHYLATVPVVTLDEGTRAILTLKSSTRHWPTFEDRLDELLRLGAIRPEWNVQPKQVLDKGTLAYMLRTTCRLPKSPNEALASLLRAGQRRYALKSCIDAGIIPYGLTYEPVTGGEMLAALAAADGYLNPERP